MSCRQRGQVTAMLAVVLLAQGGMVAAMGDAKAGGWVERVQGEGWQAGTTAQPARGGLRGAASLVFPWQCPGGPGGFAELSRTVILKPGTEARLSFTWADDFQGPTAGYHFAQVLVDGAVLWESDVAGTSSGPRRQSIPLPAMGKETLSIALRLATKKVVTNFGVRVSWTDLRLEQKGQPAADLLPAPAGPEALPVPGDLPLPALPPASAGWLREAVVLQPWGATQHAALTEVGDRPKRLREEFGFNAMIVLPPEAHNAITKPQHHLTDAQFREAVAAYRAAGYRLILYSSVMHCGHAPEWQTGRLGREYPEWSQRDPEGEPVRVYGAPWLCPNTPAREHTIAYTERLARDYGADGIMLDNNQFLGTRSGWTCYCAACRERFRAYLLRRFGAEGVRRHFGVEAGAVEIPTAEGPLHAAWLHWRNRVWAETNEEFRARLRRTNPDVLFFANTQYQFASGQLATDLQYEREDVILSESRSLTSWGMSQKMLLSGALAAGRPVWNYIGTFREDDFTRLREAEEVGPIVAASQAHGARPWIVYYGFHDAQGEYQARREMASLISWFAAHPDLCPAKRWAPVGVVVSAHSRNLRHRPLIPPHLEALLRAGVPVALIRDEHLTRERLRPFRMLTLENVPVLDEDAAKALTAWVREGGTLVAPVDAGWHDVLGRLRPRSALWQSLTVDTAPEPPTAIGRGRVVAPDADAFSAAAIEQTRPFALLDGPESGVEVVAYEAAGRLLLHLVRHKAGAGATALRLPAEWRAAKQAHLHAPGLAEPRILPIARTKGAATVRVIEPPLHCVVEVTR